ncbi:hypothetical protein L0F63_004631, partial [Massospora cicadina]
IAFQGWEVKLKRFGAHHCNGVLASKTQVLTSAQCALGNVSEWQVETSDQLIAVGVKSVLRHPNYNHSTNINDIAIFELTIPIHRQPASFLKASDTEFDKLTPDMVLSNLTKFNFVPSEKCHHPIDSRLQFCGDITDCKVRPGSPVYARFGTKLLVIGLASPNHCALRFLKTTGVFDFIAAHVNFLPKSKPMPSDLANLLGL